MTAMDCSAAGCLPADGYAGSLVGRAWLPGPKGGPAIVAVREDGVHDLGGRVPTMSTLLEWEDPAAIVRSIPGRKIGDLDELLANTAGGELAASKPHLLAPSDLQVIKAAGVTFVTSLLERLIEEKADGDLAKAARIRSDIERTLGTELREIRPGSAEAMELKRLLQRQGLWSQYLEVGIGRDAEIFTKAPVLSAVGTGMDVGLHPASEWNNPESEVVLAVNSRGRIVGASLGNDVNLRDFEGRSALLLSQAKDNNASCAIGPFIRLLDESYSLDDIRREDLHLTIEGEDGFVLNGTSTMREISRDPEALVRQAIGREHQYPDGFMFFLGTLFAPIEDRDAPGRGFTHHVGDRVTIRSQGLGALCNRVTTSDRRLPGGSGCGR